MQADDPNVEFEVRYGVRPHRGWGTCLYVCLDEENGESDTFCVRQSGRDTLETPVAERVCWPSLSSGPTRALELSIDEARRIRSDLKGIALPIIGIQTSPGLGFTDYALEIDDGVTTVSLKWRGALPDLWLTLQPIVDRLTRLLNSPNWRPVPAPERP